MRSLRTMHVAPTAGGLVHNRALLMAKAEVRLTSALQQAARDPPMFKIVVDDHAGRNVALPLLILLLGGGLGAPVLRGVLEQRGLTLVVHVGPLLGLDDVAEGLFVCCGQIAEILSFRHKIK